jgi:DNA-binding response OmpR family regulator
MTDSMVQIIEDEPLHAMLLDRALRHARFTTALAADGHTGWEDAQRLLPSLILLDLMLTDMGGHDVCRLVRKTQATRHIPIIMLTAVGSEENRIAGLEMGADDYIVKPFSPREVVSRVQALLRRAPPPPLFEADLESDASITVRGPCFEVFLRDRQIIVSRTELALLRFMLARPGVLVTAERLIALPGNENRRISPANLEHSVRVLRRKLENSGAGSIHILPGSQYRFFPYMQLV